LPILAAIALAGPQPGPELKKLEYFVGESTSIGTMTLGSTTGTFAAKDHAEW
jgi:hypothetical protein